MATMVCRGLQPCVDSQFIETTWPRMASPHIKLNPQLSPPFQFALNSCFLDLDCSKSLDQCDEFNQILLNYNATNSALPLPIPIPNPPSDSPKKSDDDVTDEAKSAMALPTKELDQTPYVHPLVKRSRSTLSQNSLALCTEDLGSETGAADFVEDAIFSDLKIERSNSTRKRVKSSTNQGSKKVFPPPLTTIAGVDSIRVRSHREDGRLIMEAVKAPARLSYFHVERNHGRLRLSILKSSTPKFDSEEEESTEKKVVEEEEEEKVRNDDVEEVGEKSNCEEGVGGKVEENRNLGFGGPEIEIEKLERPCRIRCNEAASENNNNNVDENKNNSIEMLLFTREPHSIWVSTS